MRFACSGVIIISDSVGDRRRMSVIAVWDRSRLSGHLCVYFVGGLRWRFRGLFFDFWVDLIRDTRGLSLSVDERCDLGGSAKWVAFSVF